MKLQAHFLVCGFLLLTVLMGNAGEVYGAENPYPEDWFYKDASKLEPWIGKRAPNIYIKKWMNGPVRKKDIKGKILVLNFWATWCPTCMDYLPRINKFSKRFKKKGVAFLGICGSKSGQEQMADVVREKNLAYPIGRDHTLKTEKAWKVSWYPTNIVVGRDGKIVAAGVKSSCIGKLLKRILKAEKKGATEEEEGKRKKKKRKRKKNKKNE